jgi:hypothetical protein
MISAQAVEMENGRTYSVVHQNACTSQNKCNKELRKKMRKKIAMTDKLEEI